MSSTTERTLRLLSLLQRRSHWSGPELAARLEVTERTLRRDVERLRQLGYRVDAQPGVGGGYRLSSAGGAMALLLDDDEVVALVAALHGATAGRSELAEASLGALTKVLPMLGVEQRRTAEALRTSTDLGAPRAEPTLPALATLDVVASACRDGVRLSFDYVAADGAATRRYVEPYALVALDRRWYLVAHDLDRDDWRTFRLDRMAAPLASRNRFEPRPLPADDLHDHVRYGLRHQPAAHHVVLEVEAAGERVRPQWGAWVRVDDLGPSRCRVEMEAESFRWPTLLLAELGVAFRVLEPPELQEHLRRIGEVFSVSTGDAHRASHAGRLNGRGGSGSVPSPSTGPPPGHPG